MRALAKRVARWFKQSHSTTLTIGDPDIQPIVDDYGNSWQGVSVQLGDAAPVRLSPDGLLDWLRMNGLIQDKEPQDR